MADEQLQKRVDVGLKITQKFINEMEISLRKAINDENWSRAAEIKSYISGMTQILIIFQQAVSG